MRASPTISPTPARSRLGREKCVPWKGTALDSIHSSAAAGSGTGSGLGVTVGSTAVARVDSKWMITSYHSRSGASCQ